MADFMNASKIDSDEFVSKYHNYMVPSYEILIGGTSLTKEKKIISDVKVEISVKNVAGIGIFTISDCYDNGEKSFQSDIKSKLKLGEAVEIKLGYSDVNETIFKGHIESLNYEYSEVPMITVVCMDMIYILMQNFTIERKKIDYTVNDMVKQLLDNNNCDCEVDSISGGNTKIQKAQNTSDYDFIKKIADENGFEFFDLLGKVYFRQAKKVKESITTLKFQAEVISFTRELRYKNIEITVMGKKDEDNTTIKGTSNGKTNAPYIKESYVSKKTIIAGSLQDSGEANKRATIEVENYLEDAYDAKLICIGRGEIVPGRFIEVSGFDKDFDKKYYITKVYHEFSSGEYTTTIQLSNNE